MPTRILFAVLTLVSGLVLSSLSARAAEPPHIMAHLDPWLELAEMLEEEAVRRLNDRRPRLHRLKGGGYLLDLEAFAEETHALAHDLRLMPEGNEPACILKGLALDLERLREVLDGSRDPMRAQAALVSIAQLLGEPRLIFRSLEASWQGGFLPVAVTGAPNDCDAFTV